MTTHITARTPDGKVIGEWKRDDQGELILPKKSVLQDWVMELGLRHQGVLLTAIRGPDGAPKEDNAKALIRVYRSLILNAHCGDPRKSGSYIEYAEPDEVLKRMTALRKSLDHYNHHFIMHLVHCVEIIGYKHPDPSVRSTWWAFYLLLCKGLHVNPETEEELDSRLNADEETFVNRSKA